MESQREAPAPSAPLALGKRPRALTFPGSLRHRDFRLLWLGTLAFSSTNIFQFFAIARLIEDHFPRVLGESFPILLMLGLVGLIRGASMLLFTIPGGALADRHNRRSLALLTQCVAVALVVLFSLLLAMGSIQLWQVFLLLFAPSASQMFDLPARQALIPQLVEPREITNAVALFTGAMQTSMTYSAFLAGYTLDTMGIAGTYAISGIGHGSLLLALLLIKPREQTTPLSRTSLLSQVREGFGYARQSPTIMGILIIAFTISALGMATIANLTPYWMLRVLKVSPTTWGLLASMWGLGSLVTAYSLSALRGAGHRPALPGRSLPLRLAAHRLGANPLGSGCGGNTVRPGEQLQCPYGLGRRHDPEPGPR